MKIEFSVPFRRVPAPRTLLADPVPEGDSPPPRISRLLALAHKLDALVRSGAVSSYCELARLGHISPARLSQFMVLLHLAPSIQEYVLFLSTADARFITELGLRKIAREPRWERQRKLFEQHIQEMTCFRGATERSLSGRGDSRSRRRSSNDHLGSTRTNEECTRKGEHEGPCCQAPSPRRANQSQAGPHRHPC